METQEGMDPTRRSMKFMRARQSAGDRHFTEGPLGINMLRLMLPAINEELPVELQSKNIKGHSGRHSFVSNSVNNGIDSQVVAQASKHKDVNSVKRYLKADVKALSNASIAIASAGMKRKKPVAEPAATASGGESGEEEDDDDDDDVAALLEQLRAAKAAKKKSRGSSKPPTIIVIN
jgi:hypothetical protein